MGLSTDRIVNNHTSSLEHLFCSICHEILWHPVTCETCEHSFCKACLDQWFQHQQRCPYTCEYQQRARTPHLLIQLLSQLKVICKNTANGCTEVISYEALEKHEQTCGYEMKKCQGCLQPILKQDVDRHELQCDQVEILCINCQITYRRQDGHNAIQCMRNQIKNQNDLFERKLTSLENDVRRQTELLNNIDQQQKALIERLDRQAKEAEEKTKKIIRFDDAPSHQYGYCPLQQISYGDFLWSNCTFLPLSDQESQKCQNIYKSDQQRVLYSNRQFCYTDVACGQYTENPISFSAINIGQTFNIESMEVFSITDDNSQDTQINGIRNNQTCFTRRIRLHNQLQLITLNWTNIDTLTIAVGHLYHSDFKFAISEIVIILP